MGDVPTEWRRASISAYAEEKSTSEVEENFQAEDPSIPAEWRRASLSEPEQKPDDTPASNSVRAQMEEAVRLQEINNKFKKKKKAQKARQREAKMNNGDEDMFSSDDLDDSSDNDEEYLSSSPAVTSTGRMERSDSTSSNSSIPSDWRRATAGPGGIKQHSEVTMNFASSAADAKIPNEWRRASMTAVGQDVSTHKPESWGSQQGEEAKVSERSERALRKTLANPAN